MMSAALEKLRSLLLGEEPKQQLRASQALLSLGIYLSLAVVQHAEVLLGLVDEADSWRLTAFYLTGGTVFYLAIRLGLNLRVAGDKALTVPQISWGLVAVAWSYAITGPARGAILVIVMLLMTFSVFSLKPKEVGMLSVVAFVLLAGVMLWRSLTNHYDPRVEGVHLVFTALCIAAVSVLSIRVGSLRARLQQRKNELATALARIEALATIDELTGLTNRRAVMARLRSDLSETDRAPATTSVALIDIDHFKRVNDTLGHAAGDAVLRRFAEAGQAVLRAGDVLARWGGEEFLLVMPATTDEQALNALDRVRDRLLATSFDDVSPGLRMTFSAGIAQCGGEADLEAAIERADRAMYRAKDAGRDRALTAA
ncbi:MAG: GGDEF domain-containing protein [Lautropia sp.]